MDYFAVFFHFWGLTRSPIRTMMKNARPDRPKTNRTKLEESMALLNKSIKKEKTKDRKPIDPQRSLLDQLVPQDKDNPHKVVSRHIEEQQRWFSGLGRE